MTFLKRSILSLAWLLLIAGASPAFAQRVLTQTTISSALDGVSTQMVLTSATGFAVGDAPSGPKFAVIDGEMLAVSTVNGTIVRITRGVNGTRATPHVSGETITVGPASAFNTFAPNGQCQRTLLASVPYVVGGGPGGGSENGAMFDCLGLTVNGQWVQTNGSSGSFWVLGSTVASATSVTPTGNYFKMSGTVNPVSTIVTPAGIAPGFQLFIEPTGAWVTDTAGNILIASTAVTGKLMIMTWNGTKWSPSY